MSDLTQIQQSAILHQIGGNNGVKYSASVAEEYGKLTFSTDSNNGVSLEEVKRVVGLATPTADTQAANKKYVDDQVSAASAGLDAKDSVLCATTGDNITLSAPGTIDGVTLNQQYQRVLVKDQTTASENGIYVTGAGPSYALTRASDMDEDDEVAGAYVFIQEGTSMGGQGWVVTAPRDVPTPTIGSDDITWTQFSGATPIADGTVTNDMLAGGIVNGKLVNSSVSFGGVEVSLGASDATPAFNLSDATNYPTSQLVGTISNDQLAGSIGQDKLAGSIPNEKLANSSVTFGGVEVALGASDATPAFDLTDATNYPTSSLVGTITNAQLGGSIGQDKLAGSIPVNKTNLAGGAGLAISGDTIAVDLHATTPCVEIHESKLRLKIKGSAGLEATEQGVGVADNGIANAMLAAGAVTNAKIQAGTVQNDRLQNSSVSFGGIQLALGASDATPAFDLTDATNYPTTSLTGTITNAQLGGSIANDKLANSSLSFGGVSVALGGTDATPAFDLADATNYPTSSLVGTITNAQLAGSIGQDKLAGSIPVNKTNLAGGAGLAISGDTIAVDLHATTPCVEIHESKLRLKIKGSAGLEATEQGVGVADNGIANAMLAAGAVTNAKIQAGTVQNDRLQNSSVSFGGIQLALGASDATPAFDLTDATNYPTSSLTGTITNAQLDGSIANDKLVNSAITIAGTATSLGGSIDATAIAAATAPAFANDAISGDKINGGTIGSITISALAGAMDCNSQIMTNVNIDSGNIDGVNITASTLSSTSDARLKQNIETIPPEEALRVIRESRGVTFRYKKECGGFDSAGVVAQEADKVLPRVVSKRACKRTGLADRHSVDYQAYTGYLLAAQKEMLRRVEELEQCCRKRKRGRDEEGAAAKKSR